MSFYKYLRIVIAGERVLVLCMIGASMLAMSSHGIHVHIFT
jgi:hypothetical protein